MINVSLFYSFLVKFGCFTLNSPLINTIVTENPRILLLLLHN